MNKVLLHIADQHHCVAMFREPYAGEASVVSMYADVPLAFTSTQELRSQEGFVMIPFREKGVDPIWLIKGDEQWNVTVTDRNSSEVMPSNDTGREMSLDYSQENADVMEPSVQYSEAFGRFHKALKEGRFEKLVLSRKEQREADTSPQAIIDLYVRACRMYPRLMVYMVSVPRKGVWMGCTPEILVDGGKSHFRTVALAGTMQMGSGIDQELKSKPVNEVWSRKNIEEQAYVAQYVRSVLAPIAQVLEEEGPYTSRAGKLYHLKTEFHFIPRHPFSIVDLIGGLHPTPAVCGLPKEESRTFIEQQEGYDRGYYAGVVGWIDDSLKGASHLYVNLRCAHLQEGKAQLYAGGGILAESDLLNEWYETVAKMATIGRVIDYSRKGI